MQINRRRHSVATTLLALAISMSGCSMLPSIENSIATGTTALANGELDKAEQNFQQAITDAEKSGKKEQLATAKVGLADTYVAEENYDDAETLYTDALEIVGDTTNQTTERINHGLGKLNLKRKHYALAEKHLKMAHKQQQDLPDAEPVETATILCDLGELYQLKGRSSLAKENFEDSLEILDGLERKQYTLQAKVVEALAQIAGDEEDADAAQDYKKRLTELQLSHAKKVMTVLPWVKNKNVQESNDDESEEKPESDSNN